MGPKGQAERAIVQAGGDKIASTFQKDLMLAKAKVDLC
jgi:hypothetical protein